MMCVVGEAATLKPKASPDWRPEEGQFGRLPRCQCELKSVAAVSLKLCPVLCEVVKLVKQPTFSSDDYLNW